MAILYYPKSSVLARKDASNPLYEQLILATAPNMVYYFDTSSVVNAASASNLFITSSWAETASISILYASNSFMAETASFALNAQGGGTTIASGSSWNITSSWANNLSNVFAYEVISTSSGNWITVSLVTAESYVTITVGALYNFTCSNPPSVGSIAYSTLYINNTAGATSSLSFPSNWVFMGGIPASISASKAGILSIKSFGGSPNVAAFTAQY